MTDRHSRSRVSLLSRTWATLHLHWRALVAARAARRRHAVVPVHGFKALLNTRRPLVRVMLLGTASLAVLIAIGGGLLIWKLNSGPLSVDMVTPWLASAIEERFGSGHRIEVGGTQLERDEDGRTALRMLDIVVRDRDGTIVASAPKAEVGISAAGLLTGQLQAVRLNLIGAAMAIRVEEDGRLNIFAGADARPIAAAPGVVGSIDPGTGNEREDQRGPQLAAVPTPVPAASGRDVFGAVLTWLEGLDLLGLDGRDLSEIGLRNGSLVVDDRRNGKHWKFDNINLSLTRPKEGGVALTISSTGTDGPWSLTATVTPRGGGRRAIEAVFRDLSPKDILLALRLGDGTVEADMPLSAIVRAEIAADGAVQIAEGRLVAGAGVFGRAQDPNRRILIDEARFDWRWDAANRLIVMPFEIQAGANRISLLAHIMPPSAAGGAWQLAVSRGMLMLASADRGREPPLVLDRVQLRGWIDPTKRQIQIEQGDLHGMAAGLALSGALDYAGPIPQLSFGLAATRMSVSAFKRLWPFFVAVGVRPWVIEHVPAGTIDRVVIATNAPLPVLTKRSEPIPDDALSAEIVANATLHPVPTLPAIRDGDISVRVTGRTAKVTLGRAVIDLPSGRRLTVSDGVFEVPDTAVDDPPARLHMRIEGSVEAAAELLTMEPLRGESGILLDPATTRGHVSARVSLAWPLLPALPPNMMHYEVDADIANLSAERLVRGQRLEAAHLRVNAHPQGFQAKGEVRIGGTPATIDYRRKSGGDADLRAQVVLDDYARERLGFDASGTISGPVPVKISGRIAAGGDSRFAVDADLSQANISDLLPGWSKPAGRPARATFTLIDKAQSRRFEDLVLDGSGARLRGVVELSADGDIVSANFPTFALSDGDKAALRAERGPDGTLRVTLRGDVYDGRGFIKRTLVGAPGSDTRRSASDLDLDIKLGAVAGFNGEVLRGFELRLSRRAGEIRTFALNARLVREAALVGELRGRGGRQLLQLETADAGALFRFTDMYPRMFGGRLSVTMDPPSAQHRPEEGILNIRDFVIRGEPTLDRIASSAPPTESGLQWNPGRQQGIQFTRMRVEFSRSPGRLIIREGVVAGPAVGATVDGQIDFARDEVRMRGTFVPAYALNNIPAQVPILGLFLGGGRNEGLLGVTYEVVGPPNGMTLRVNPMSAVAPGFLRKLFEFRSADDQAFTATEPAR